MYWKKNSALNIFDHFTWYHESIFLSAAFNSKLNAGFITLAFYHNKLIFSSQTLINRKSNPRFLSLQFRTAWMSLKIFRVSVESRILFHLN